MKGKHNGCYFPGWIKPVICAIQLLPASLWLRGGTGRPNRRAEAPHLQRRTEATAVFNMERGVVYRDKRLNTCHTVAATSMCLVNEGGETGRRASAQRYGDGFPSLSTLMVIKKITPSQNDHRLRVTPRRTNAAGTDTEIALSTLHIYFCLQLFPDLNHFWAVQNISHQI